MGISGHSSNCSCNECKLKLCPFCGHYPRLMKPFNSNFYRAVCEYCESTGGGSINIEFAIELWNRRINENS